MKKSIMALFIAVLMLSSFSVSAESVADFFSQFPIPEEYNISVNADMEVRKSSETDYVDGPVNVRKSSNQKWPTFDFRATIYMDKVRQAFKRYNSVAKAVIADDVALLEEYKKLPVYGVFIVSATYPSSLSLPSDFLEAKDLYGFSEEVKQVFKELERTETKEGKWKTLSIKVSVKSPDGTKNYITQADLESNLEKYLPDFTLTCENVKTSAHTSCTVYGDVEGYTNIGANSGPDKVTSIIYEAKQLSGKGDEDSLSASVKVVSVSTDSEEESSSSAGTITFPAGANSSKNEIMVSFDVDGITNVLNAVVGNQFVSLNIDSIKKPVKDGYYFDGWYSDKACTKRVSGTVTASKDMVLYGNWVNLNAPAVFNSENHIAYIYGYEDGTVRPEGNITREEIATILYRLLTEEYKSSIYSENNSFSDVDNTRWSNVAVSTLSNGGYLKGYPEDETYRPSNPVTRAEFASIVSRFYEPTSEVNEGFYDLAGHWAENAVLTAVASGLIDGYEDGTFRPDNYVTRAEAMTIINRMLVRYLDAPGLPANIKVWPDNASNAWYYYHVIEATMGHTYERKANDILENWTSVLSE